MAYAREQARKESDPQAKVWPTQPIDPPEPQSREEQPLPLYKHIEPIPIDILLPPGMKRKTGDLARAWHREKVVPTIKTDELTKPPTSTRFYDPSWMNDRIPLPTLTSEQRLVLDQLTATPPETPAVSEETLPMLPSVKLNMMVRTSQPGF